MFLVPIYDAEAIANSRDSELISGSDFVLYVKLRLADLFKTPNVFILDLFLHYRVFNAGIFFDS